MLRFFEPVLFSARRGIVLALTGATLLVGGCATSPVNHEVTVFHDWPADITDRAFRFAAPSGEVDELKYQTWRKVVRDELIRAGFSESAGSGQRPPLEVSFDYQVESRTLRYRRTTYFAPHLYFGHYYRHGGISISTPLWWDTYPHSVPENIVVYDHKLKLSFSDLRAGAPAKVFEGSGVSRARKPLQIKALPLLVRAVLKDFPGISGVVRQVPLSPETGKNADISQPGSVSAPR